MASEVTDQLGIGVQLQENFSELQMGLDTARVLQLAQFKAKPQILFGFFLRHNRLVRTCQLHVQGREQQELTQHHSVASQELKCEAVERGLVSQHLTNG